MSSPTPAAPWLNLGEALRALLPPVISWAAVVVVVTAGGYPGVACITPMAWLLGLWSGARYALGTAERPDRWPLLGPALIGALLGAAQGGLFVYGVTVMMAGEARPEELAKGQALTVGLVLAGVAVCAAISAFNAWRTYRRLAPRTTEDR